VYPSPRCSLQQDCGRSITFRLPPKLAYRSILSASQGADNPGSSGCSFNSLEACEASASGTEAECLTNPWYRPGVDAAPPSPQGPTGMGGPLPIGPPPNR
jgi:hypothetical protein